MPLSQWQVSGLGLAILAPTVIVALLIARRNAPGLQDPVLS
jgi:hypothetical protein